MTKVCDIRSVIEEIAVDLASVIDVVPVEVLLALAFRPIKDALVTWAIKIKLAVEDALQSSLVPHKVLFTNTDVNHINRLV